MCLNLRIRWGGVGRCMEGMEGGKEVGIWITIFLKNIINRKKVALFIAKNNIHGAYWKQRCKAGPAWSFNTYLYSSLLVQEGTLQEIFLNVLLKEILRMYSSGFKRNLNTNPSTKYSTYNLSWLQKVLGQWWCITCGNDQPMFSLTWGSFT